MLIGFVDSFYLIIVVISKCLVENILSTYIFNPIFPHWYIILYPYGLHPLELCLRHASMFFIVALSCERYQAFFSPFEHRAKFWPYFITGFITSITLLVQHMFTFEYVYNDEGEIVNFVLTKLNSDPLYKTFFYTYEFYGILSCSVLVLLNIKIYWQLRSVKNSSKYRSARVLFLIVLTFLFCHGVRIVIAAFAFSYPIIQDQRIYCFSQGRQI